MRVLSKLLPAGICLGLGVTALASVAQATEDPAKISDPGDPHHRRVHARAAATTSSPASSAEKLSESFGQPVIIENKPGAGAILATEYVARAEPDGYTLLVGASGAMKGDQPGGLCRRLHYDTLRDFVPVSELGSFPLILIVQCRNPQFKSLAELVAYAKAESRQGQLFQLLRRIPACHRTVQAEDRRADADDPLQGRQ